MLRVISFLLGFGLIVLWAVGLGSEQATTWLTWLDGVAAVCAFSVGAIGGRRPALAAGSTDLLLAMGLFVLWIVALAHRATGWQAWWTFAFACVYLALGMAGVLIGERGRPELQKLA
jgi:hypothetical protein